MSPSLFARLNYWLYTTALPIPYPVRSWLATSLAGRRRIRVHLPNLDIVLDLDLADILQTNLYLDRKWEPDISNWVAFFASRSRVMFDIGAHIGYFLLIMRQYAPQGASIHAFEPNRYTFELLKQNLALNGVTQVVPNQIAIADTKGEAQFQLPSRLQLGTASLRKQVAHAETESTINTISLDRYCEENDLSQVDLVKMDIEGGELRAIAGMRAGLQHGWYDVLLIEFHQALLDSTEKNIILNELRTAGYHLFELYSDRLAAAEVITTPYFCAFSPKIYQALGTPEVYYMHADDLALPFVCEEG